MKKLIYTLFAVCLFTACSSDDDNDDNGKGNNTNKEFKWNGDWNDPKDPNYVKDGYNPIVGLWEDINNERIRLRYTADFKEIMYIQNKSTGIYKPDEPDAYVINDTAFRTRTNRFRRYKFVDGKLLQNILAITGTIMDDRWYEYKRVAE